MPVVLDSQTEHLKEETAEVEGKEKELVQQCLEQFSESLPSSLEILCRLIK